MTGNQHTGERPAPARAGLFIYAVDHRRMAEFYAAVAGMLERHATAEMIILESADIQLLVHRIPPQIAAEIVIETPPRHREDAALKFFLTVPDLAEARRAARAHGGDVLEPRWQGPGFVVHNAVDPEGNLFQLRQAVVQGEESPAA